MQSLLGSNGSEECQKKNVLAAPPRERCLLHRALEILVSTMKTCCSIIFLDRPVADHPSRRRPHLFPFRVVYINDICNFLRAVVRIVKEPQRER